VTQQPPDEPLDPTASTREAPSASNAADAAEEAVEPERLLPGENEDSVHPDDAVHWTKVYSELLGFKRSLLTLAEERVTSMYDAARTEVEETDMKILQAEAQRLERRFAFWRAKAATLTRRST
jgi:hypothetical protein